MIFNPGVIDGLVKFANLMADGGIMLPKHLQDKPAACMAITMQAAQWGMNPFVVAQKTHDVNGVLGYEAQLVNAVVKNSGSIAGRFHYKYEGDWSKCTKSKEVTRDKTGKNGKYTVTERVRDWTDADEIGLSITVGAVLTGESEITWGEPIFLSSIAIRNSPLWATNPKQQIAYLGVKYWSRLYCPEAILGVYTIDELEAAPPRTERDITPPAGNNSAELNAAINGQVEVEPTQQPKPERTQDDILASFTEAASNAKSIEELNLVFNGGTHPDGKKRPGAKDVLTDRWLEMAEDVYQIRHEEINDIPM
ncbi:recombinase RecT [Pectobacterium sp. 21LCBS03]|nr:RecT family recombinase [Pectobacterium sp. 21LCBS03]UPY97242.1 recombinase RecT [Pectobacterium sp. 21LCBS03]